MSPTQVSVSREKWCGRSALPRMVRIQVSVCPQGKKRMEFVVFPGLKIETWGTHLRGGSTW
jgi:hypothetical protein